MTPSIVKKEHQICTLSTSLNIISNNIYQVLDEFKKIK